MSSSSDDTNAASPSNINTTSAEETSTVSPSNILSMSSPNTITKSPNGITAANASNVTTSTKRKQASPDAQEEAEESPQKKKTRLLTNSEYIRDTFGYTFKNLSLLYEALDTTGIRYCAQSNQTLALIGDSVLNLIIYRDWYPSKQLKGTGNQLIQTIACNANLARVGLRIGLDKYIVTAQNIVPTQSLLATTMEAILGAIDCDSGEDADAVRKAMSMVGLTPGTAFRTS